MELNISQAAKAAGISRATMNRHIKRGKVSVTQKPTGEKCIDPAELVRVYGQLKTQHDTGSETPKRDTLIQHETPKSVSLTQEIDRLRHENDALKNDLKVEREKRDDERDRLLREFGFERDRFLRIIERQALALPEPKKLEPIEPPRKKKWWERLIRFE